MPNSTLSVTLLAAEEEHNPIVPEIPEIIAALIFLGILFFIIAKFVAPRFEQTFNARTEAIEGGIKQAEEMQAQAKAALEEYQSRLAEARHEASRIREEAREQGAAIVVEMREQAQAEADRITTAANTRLEAERQQVVAQLRAEIGDLATTLAGRIVGESLDDEARQRRVVERFLTELEQDGDGPVSSASSSSAGTAS